LRRYTPASADILAIVQEVRTQYHPVSLSGADLAVVLVTASTEIAPAVVKIASAAQRASGAPDAALLLDARRWADTSHPGRVATVDHGLMSAYVERHPTGVVKLDGAGRPVIRKQAPDLGVAIGFGACLRRHKARSVENARLLTLRGKVGIEAPEAPPTAPAKPKRRRKPGGDLGHERNDDNN
jgi:hypothetical protein